VFLDAGVSAKGQCKQYYMVGKTAILMMPGLSRKTWLQLKKKGNGGISIKKVDLVLSLSLIMPGILAKM
jgi:hypothetical protein